MKNKTNSIAAMRCVLFLILATITVASFAQVAPAPTSTSAKKAVKISDKWYIETTTTSKAYTELNTQLLLQIENDAEDAKRDDHEVERVQDDRLLRKTERIERNQLLKEAITKGFVPQATTLEEQAKIKAAKTKLGIK